MLHQHQHQQQGRVIANQFTYYLPGQPSWSDRAVDRPSTFFHAAGKSTDEEEDAR